MSSPTLNTKVKRNSPAMNLVSSNYNHFNIVKYQFSSKFRTNIVFVLSIIEVYSKRHCLRVGVNLGVLNTTSISLFFFPHFI